jgi:hypothetical protein
MVKTDEEKAAEIAAKAEEKRLADNKKSEERKLAADKKAAELEERKIIEENKKKALEEVQKNKVVLKNVFGDEIDEADYFFAKDGKGKAPSYFNKVCGFPVDRDDMIVIFNRIFKPEYNFLFYKVRDKEVYLIIVPLKYAESIGGANESMPGDFQKHAISFISEGSVNMESLRMKLERVSSTIKIRN